MAEECSNCGAPSEAAAFRCSYCDTPLAGADAARSRRADALVLHLEAQLHKLSRGTALAVCLFLVSIPGAFALARYNAQGYLASTAWTLAAGFCALMVLGAVVQRERAARYRTTIRPQVVAFLRESSMPPEDLLDRARKVLLADKKRDSRLLRHLTDIAVPGDASF